MITLATALTAWVLVFSEGRTAITISGIATREACVALKNTMQADKDSHYRILPAPSPEKWACYEYPSIISTGDSRI